MPGGRHRHRGVSSTRSMAQSSEQGERGARVAFLGNSILYYNDCPRFLVNLGKGSAGGYVEHQDSCLRGGTNLSQLWESGNGMMSHGFKTEAAKTEDADRYDVGSNTVKDLLQGGGGAKRWDYIVFNDHTQGPARLASRRATEDVLVEKYLPLIIQCHATPIIIETCAYRLPGINDSKDLGSTNDFQQRVKEGVRSYLNALQARLPEAQRPRVAPVGEAFLYVHDDNRTLWERLFDPSDNFHPSPSGTFLQGCVIHRTMFGSSPPLPTRDEDIADLWKGARMMHNVKAGECRPLPSVPDAEYLWSVASRIVL